MTLLEGCGRSSRSDLKEERMNKTMDNPKITYVIHIATTPEKLWEALTSPEALKENWGKIKSQWTVGSRVTEVSGSGKLLWEGQVLQSEPVRLLSYTFDVTGSGELPTEVRFELSPPASEVAPGESI